MIYGGTPCQANCTRKSGYHQAVLGSYTLLVKRSNMRKTSSLLCAYMEEAITLLRSVFTKSDTGGEPSFLRTNSPSVDHVSEEKEIEALYCSENGVFFERNSPRLGFATSIF